MYTKSLGVALTFATAVILSGYVSPSFAAKPNCNLDPSHPSCDDTDPPPVTAYTVDLAGPVFQVDGDSVSVSPNSKGTALFPDEPLTFFRPANAGAARDAWDALFRSCENFFGPYPVGGIGPAEVLPPEQFTVPAGETEIWQSGGVVFSMVNIPFDSNGISTTLSGHAPHFQVNVGLRGYQFFGNGESFLPAENSIDYREAIVSITGGTVKGVRPKDGCVSGGRAEPIVLGGDPDNPDPSDPDPSLESTLTITAP